MKNLLLAVATLFSVSIACAQTAPTANSLLQAAYAKAAKENKKVFVKFSASWCVWCHKMDASIKDPAVSKFFDDHYVFVILTVDESAEHKNLENAGANEIRTKFNGDGIGIPFWVVLDIKGNLLADSYIRTAAQTAADKGANIGCPAQPREVTAFIEVLKKTSNITPDQEKAVAEVFKKNDVSQQSH